MPGICGTTIEVDLHAAPAFAAAMCAEVDWADGPVVFIDCSSITSMDTSAVHALVYAHRYALDHGHLLVARNLQWNCVRTTQRCDRYNELRIET